MKGCGISKGNVLLGRVDATFTPELRVKALLQPIFPADFAKTLSQIFSQPEAPEAEEAKEEDAVKLEKEEEEAVVFEDEVNPADKISQHKAISKVVEHVKKSLGTFYPKTGYIQSSDVVSFVRLGRHADKEDSYTDLLFASFGWFGKQVHLDVDLRLYLLEVRLDLATLDHLGLDVAVFQEPLRFAVPPRWESNQVGKLIPSADGKISHRHSDRH